MFESDKRSALERLKKGLYSRTDRFGESPRHGVRAVSDDVPASWQADEPTPEPEHGHPMRRWYVRAVFVALGISIIATTVMLYTVLGGRSFVSVDNIDILIEGPAAIAGGERTLLTVSIENQNATDMELADLIVEFPPGTKDPQDPARNLERSRISVGNIQSGTMVTRTVGATFYGETGQEQKVKLTVEYRTPGSNAIFFKEKYFEFSLSSSPLTITIDGPDSITAGTESAFRIAVSSNTTSVIKDVLVSLEYPFGWAFSSADPRPSTGETLWRLGDLAPGAKRTITLRGRVEGQDGEARTIHAVTGIESATNENEIGTEIVSESHTFSLERPFLGIDLALNGMRTGDLSAEPGKLVRADVIWTNNTPDKITNGRIEARLSGSALDRSSVSSDGSGYYDSKTTSIIWDSGRIPELKEIAPGATGRVGFSFYPTRTSTGGNASISVSVVAGGSRTTESGGTTSLETSVSRSVRLVSNVALATRVLRTQGPISNTGPIPPKVDTETTYTIIWTLTNTANAVSRMEVRSTLPQGVRWTGVTSPAEVDFSYDESTGDIVWRAGSMAGGGVSTVREVAFQVGITPSISAIGSVPQLIGQSTVTAVDDFTGATLRNTAPAQTTRTTTDIFWKTGDETVVQ